MGPGDVITIPELKRRSARLLMSGLFADVRYKYMLRGSAIDITFALEEKPWDTPVAFDNYIWFDDAFLHAAIAEAIPGYEGKIPYGGSDLTRRIMAILDKVLEEHGIAAKTDSVSLDLPSVPFGKDVPLRVLIEATDTPREARIPDLPPSSREAWFAVKGPPLSICSVDFVGDHLPQDELGEMTRALLGEPYSRRHVRIYATATIEPIFRNRGYLDVDVHVGRATQSRTADCEGVRLSLAIEPGVTYRFDGFTWKGDLLVPEDVMESSMEIAKDSVCDEGLVRRQLDDLLKSYGAHGYLDPRYSLERKLDRGARRVVYGVAIEKGPLYHMGRLELLGLSGPMEKWARSNWELEPGRIFDSTYPERFLEKIARKKRTQSTTQLASGRTRRAG